MGADSADLLAAGICQFRDDTGCCQPDRALPHRYVALWSAKRLSAEGAPSSVRLLLAHCERFRQCSQTF
jgi:hypothetical protein